MNEQAFLLFVSGHLFSRASFFVSGGGGVCFSRPQACEHFVFLEPVLFQELLLRNVHYSGIVAFLWRVRLDNFVIGFGEW